MEIADRIKLLISESGITQSELARKSGISFGTLNRVLNGKQPLMPNTLKKLADGLGVSVSDLEENCWSFNYAVQGYLQFAEEITHITSFKQLKRWVAKHEPLVNALPKQVKEIQNEEKRNAKKVAKSILNIDSSSIDLFREETIDASSVETWSFRKAEDERDGHDIDLGNMCISYPFTLNGRTFTNSEALYICGLFSNNTAKHKDIQEKLIAAKNGYNAKKVIRAKYEESYGREDWETFNVEWMKWCVRQKILGNQDFRELLKSIPRNAYIIENSTHQKGTKSLFWGMKNKELEEKRAIIEECVKYINPTLKKKELVFKIMQARNEINHIGIWHGVDCMGKILKYFQLCLLDDIEPVINYDLLRSKQIYLFGDLLTFEEAKTTQKQCNQTVIFDFDGTLLDTQPLIQYEYLFKQPTRGTKEWSKGRKEYLSHIKDCKLYDGMDEVIQYIRKNHIKCAIVTANTKDRVVEAIKAFGWSDFINKTNIIGCYSLGMNRASKDDGDSRLFAKALELMGVTADDCIAFGNELNDFKAAQSIGIKAYNCLWGASDDERTVMMNEMSENSITSPTDILEIIEK